MAKKKNIGANENHIREYCHNGMPVQNTFLKKSSSADNI